VDAQTNNPSPFPISDPFNSGTGLHRALNKAIETIMKVKDLIRDGVFLFELLIEASLVAMEDVVSLFELTNGICPIVRAAICTNFLTDLATCDAGGIFEDKFLFEEMLNHFNISNQTIVHKLTRARDDLYSMLEVADSLEQKAETFDWVLYIAMIFSILLSLLSLLVILSLFWKNIRKRMGCLLRARIFLPLFVSLLVLVFVSSITFVIASLGLADTCIDDPDARFLSVADTLKRQCKSRERVCLNKVWGQFWI
jgi:hypothetical protein